MHETGEITKLLGAIHEGDVTATEELFSLTCLELRRLAERAMRTQASQHILQPTALVNEAVIRMLGSDSLARTENRRMFYALAAAAMRSVLVDYARRRTAMRRNEGRVPHQLFLENLVEQFEEETKVDLLALDEALNTLCGNSKRQHDVVVMRFFGGFQSKEIAEQLGVSLSTVEKDWAFAKAWLRRTLG